MATTDFDLIVIGSGPGGYVAAVRAAQLGAKVAVVEKAELGGTCLNKGCIPTKALLASANVLLTIKTADGFGIKVNNITADFSTAIDRKNKIVKQLRDGIAQLFKSHRIELIKGTAKFISPQQIEVTNNLTHSTLRITQCIIATGSQPAQIPGVEIDHEKILTSDDILELTDIPSSLLIVGGGAIGVEFACIFNKFGSKVRLVEMLPRILPAEDEEVSQKLTQYLIQDGIEIKTGSRAEIEEFKNYEKVLIAVGRKPNIEGLGLENIKISYRDSGIIVNQNMETNVPKIYAIGDVVGGVLLAHKASAEGIVAAENACGKNSTIDYEVIPNCIYSIPEVASVGLTETKAKELGYEISIGKSPFTVNGRAVTLGQTRGFVKIIVDKNTGALLGVHIVGPEATELVSECALAIKLECTVEELSRIIHPHPTLSEAIFEAASVLHKN